MATLEELIIRIESDVTGVRQDMNRVESSVDSLGGGLKKLGGILLGVFAIDSINNFKDAIISAASDAEELGSKYATVFNGVTAVTDAWIADYTAATSRGEQATKSYLSSLQDVRTGYGDSIENASKFSKVVVGVTNDLSSFSNVDFDRASAAIESGLSGQFDALTSLGIGLNVAIIDQSKYAKSINKTWEEMTNLEKQEAILSGILDSSKNAVGQSIDAWQDYDFTLGDAAKTSNSYANTQKLLQQSLTDSAAAIGDVFLPAATSGLTSLVSILKSATPVIVAVFQSIVNSVEVASAVIGPFVSRFVSGISTIVSTFGQLTGISKRVTENQATDSKTRINDLITEKNARLQALKAQEGAEKSFATQSADQIKKGLETRKEALKEQLDAVKEASNIERDLVKERVAQEKEALNEKKDALKEQLDAVKDTVDKEIELRKEQTEIEIAEIDKQLDALKEAQKERIKEIDKEYEAKFKLLDEDTKAKINAVKSAQDSIRAEQDAVDLAERTRNENEKIAKLKKEIADSTDPKKQQAAEAELAEFMRDLTLRDEKESRNASINKLNDAITAIKSEATVKEEALKTSKTAAVEAANVDIAEKERVLVESKRVIKEEYDAFDVSQKAKIELAKTELVEYQKIQTEKIKAIDDEFKAFEKAENAKVKVAEDAYKQITKAVKSAGGDETESGGVSVAPTLSLEDQTTALNAEYDKLIAAEQEKLKKIQENRSKAFDLSVIVNKLNEFLPELATWGDTLSNIFQSKFEVARDTLTLVMDVIKGVFQVALQAISEFWATWGDDVNLAITNALLFFQELQNKSSEILGIIKGLWSVWGDDILAIVKRAFDLVLEALGVAFSLIAAAFDIATKLLKGDWKGVWDGIENIVKLAFEGIEKIVKKAFILLTEIITPLLDGLTTLFTNIWNGITEAISTALTTAKTKITTVWDEIIKYLKGIDLFKIGSDIIETLIKGVTSMIGDVTKSVKNVADGIANTFKDVLGIESPSKVFNGFGKNISEGIIKGIDATKKSVTQASQGLGLATSFGAERVSQASQNVSNKNINLNFTNNIKGDSLSMLDRLRQQQQELQLILQEA